MKKTLKSISAMLALLALAVFATLSFTACDNDEDPKGGQLSEEDKAMNALIATFEKRSDAMLVNADGDQLFYPVKNEMEAQSFCSEFIGEGWDGNEKTVSIARYGNLRVIQSETDGSFYKLAFDFNIMQPFTLEVCTREYIENENFIAGKPTEMKSTREAKFKCKDCGYEYQSTFDKNEVDFSGNRICPNCSSANVVFVSYGFGIGGLHNNG